MSIEKKSGCGLCNAFFGKKGFWPRRSSSTGSTCQPNNNNEINLAKSPSTPKRRRSGSDESNLLEVQQKPITKAPNHPKMPPVQQSYKPVEVATKLSSNNQGYGNQNFAYVNQGKKVPKDAVGISGELESMINDHQKSRGSANLVRASSSNVMLVGNLGNLRQPRGGNANSYGSVDNSSRIAGEEKATPNGKYPNSIMGDIEKNQNEENSRAAQQGSLCRAISTRMDPEQLKIMGNEDYKNGNFAEALALYEAAIAIDPNKAAYKSNKSAALTALGRLLEAVFECREAIRIEPHYHRAHHRLSSLYIRLGEVEKSIYHNKYAGPEADPNDISKAKAIQVHLNQCTEARRLRDWNTLLKETEAAKSAGADSAPQIYALQAEALMKLHRHQEADEAMTKCSNFSIDDCTKFLGPIGNANVLVVRAQVNLAIGRFDDALSAAQRATRLDPNSKDAKNIMRKANAVAAARAKGNQVFKKGKFYEACIAYGEGLEHDAYNSVLLCNRAACLCKLGQYEKAVEDCNAALNLRPNYTKARLRRADCYAKLENWEASIQDYEVLQKEAPEDEEVAQGLLEAKAKLKE